MRSEYEDKRYIYDPLYGVIYLPDVIWDVIPCPELQRLREVRLCNINSFCLTGGANINRYEHAIGTCFLANECLNSWPFFNLISKKEEEHLLMAALFHDYKSAAFGHSVEYIESRVGFEHESGFKQIVLGEKGESYSYQKATLEPIFFGLPRGLLSRIPRDDIEAIDEIIGGKGRLSPLIGGSIDLDNIDNVFRLGYHLGIVKSGKVPLKLAKSLWVEKGELIVKDNALYLIEEWYKVRKKLYKFLLLNPEEFSAKCMLTQAIELAKTKETIPFNWYDTDYELLMKLYKTSSETSQIIARLMTGELYGCMSIFSSSEVDKYEIFRDPNKKRELEAELTEIIRTRYLATVDLSSIDALNKKRVSENLRQVMCDSGHMLSEKVIIKAAGENRWKLEDSRHEYLLKRIIDEIKVYEILSNYRSASIALHPILDVDKTERRVRILTEKGRIAQVGESSHQLLIGVFFENRDLNMYKVRKTYKEKVVREKILAYLMRVLEDPGLEEIDLYSEAEK